MHKAYKHLVLAYLVLLVLSLAVFYMLPRLAGDELPAEVQAPESWQDEEDSWLDLRGGLYIREEWQFESPESYLQLTASEHIYNLVLVERTAADKIEVVEYATNIMLADKIKSLKVSVDGEQLVVTIPPDYEVNMVVFGREFYMNQFRRDCGYSFIDPHFAYSEQILHIKVPEHLEVTYKDQTLWRVIEIFDTP